MEVTSQRWAEAQRAEREYWEHVPTHASTLANLVAAVSSTADWARTRIPADPSTKWVEIGIGPYGIGVSHMLRTGPHQPEIVGVDPIELRSELDLVPDPLTTLIWQCRDGYEHVVARGEKTELEAGAFGAAFSHNMLDHVAAPEAVLRELRRLLRPGGHLLLACDVFSTAGRFKHTHWNQRRYPDSILVRAHPHRFSRDDLLALVRAAGFKVAAVSEPPKRTRQAIGRAHDVYVHAVSS